MTFRIYSAKQSSYIKNQFELGKNYFIHNQGNSLNEKNEEGGGENKEKEKKLDKMQRNWGDDTTLRLKQDK